MKNEKTIKEQFKDYIEENNLNFILEFNFLHTYCYADVISFFNHIYLDDYGRMILISNLKESETICYLNDNLELCYNKDFYHLNEQNQNKLIKIYKDNVLLYLDKIILKNKLEEKLIKKQKNKIIKI